MSVFADALEAHGERVALVAADGQRLTYRALAAAADAAFLPPERCLMALPITASIDSVVLYLAALRRRYPVVLLDAADSLVGTAIRSVYAPWLPGAPAPTAPVPMHADLAVLLSTSGSTGSPKLVRLSATNIDSNARSIADYLGLGPDDRAITSLPLHYSYGLSVLNSHLAVGATILLTEESVTSDAFWALFEREGATHLAGVPHSYELLERIGFRQRTLPSLRLLTQAGGRLPADLGRTIAGWAAVRGVAFTIMYGQTEATARMAYLPPALAAEHADCIGVAIPGGRFTIEDADGRDLGDGPGELVYHGPNVMMGYATAPADLALPPGPATLRTGDMAERTPAGLLRIVGRMNRFSKLFGLRIGHEEVEQWLGRQGRPALVSGDDQQLAVALEDADGTADIAAVAASIADHYGLPLASVRVVGVAALPRHASGKPDYAAVRGLVAAARASASSAAAPGSIADVFAACFPGQTIAPDQSFASLGGDSLSYVGFAIALEDLIGPLPEDWPTLTLAELESLVGSAAPPSRLWRWTDCDQLLRALAILGVVFVLIGIGKGADTIPISGGSLMLMLLFGFNMARFQLPRLLTPERFTVARDFAVRVVAPYLLLLLIYGLWKGEVQPLHWLLVSNYWAWSHGMLEPYWFIEVAAQTVLLATLAFAVPAVAGLARGRPIGFAALLLAVALLLRLVGPALAGGDWSSMRTLDGNLVYVALGWAAAILTGRLPDTAPRRLLQAGLWLVAVAVVLYDWPGHISRHLWVAVGLFLLLFVRRLPLPRPLAAAVVNVAQASFYIYMSHIIVINVMELRLHLDLDWLTMLLATLAGIALQRLVQWRPGQKPALSTTLA